VVEHKHYIQGPGGPVAVYTQRSSGNDTRYLHTDHLGSVESITDEAGNVVARLSFEPHGKRITGGGALTSRGFTGHEMDDESGLINMNAREYDPVLGRFLSPDTIVEAGFGQGLNRYSYVLNNPLSYVDPTGRRSLRDAWRNVRRIAEDAAKIYVAQQTISMFAATGYVIAGPVGGVQGARMGYNVVRAYRDGASLSDLAEYTARGYATMWAMQYVSNWMGPGPAARMMTGGIAGYLGTGDSEGFWRGFASGAVPNGFGITEYSTDPFANFVLGVLTDGVRGYIRNGEEGARDQIRAGLFNNAAGHVIGYVNSRGASPVFREGVWVYAVEGAGERFTPMAIGNVVSGSQSSQSDETAGIVRSLDVPHTWRHELAHANEQGSAGAFYLPLHIVSQGLGHLSEPLVGWRNVSVRECPS
jgi:RHS repeat-associated protein